MKMSLYLGVAEGPKKISEPNLDDIAAAEHFLARSLTDCADEGRILREVADTIYQEATGKDPGYARINYNV